jgi:soluble lytic murein transglycosylase-like protein
VGQLSFGGVVLLVAVAALAMASPHVIWDAPPSSSTQTAPPSGAPSELVAVAQQAGRLTGVDPNVLLAVSQVECTFGRCRMGLPDTLVPADVRSHVDQGALQPGGATARLLGLPDGRRVGDWVNPLPVARGQHAMGFMQFLPSTWRAEAAVAPGRPSDPYKPYDSMVVAGSYLARLQAGEEDGRRRSLRGALAAYGGELAYADRVLALLSAAR